MIQVFTDTSTEKEIQKNIKQKFFLIKRIKLKMTLKDKKKKEILLLMIYGKKINLNASLIG